jgi:hypothetical protein
LVKSSNLNSQNLAKLERGKVRLVSSPQLPQEDTEAIDLELHQWQEVIAEIKVVKEHFSSIIIPC